MQKRGKEVELEEIRVENEYLENRKQLQSINKKKGKAIEEAKHQDTTKILQTMQNHQIIKYKNFSLNKEH